jgi:ACS family hexuronate transporter-like MFS transporter
VESPTEQETLVADAETPASQAVSSAGRRSSFFRWYVCGLLFLATTINYMDRQTLANAASRVKDDFHLNNEQYGELETWFGFAFAFGSLAFGFLADRMSVRWLYPAVLLAWSLMGVATGSVHGFWGLLACRTLLGLFESGHWPCALRTTQQLLPANERTFGNSILQSGSSIGAIITPLIMAMMLTDEAGSWRFAFQVIGGIGIVWVVLWLASVGKADLNSPVEPEQKLKREQKPLPSQQSFVRRFIVLAVVVICINACWHLFRVWLPLFLQEGRGYSEQAALGFTSAFYVATDVGCIGAGLASVALHRQGLSVGFARWSVFAACSLLTMLSIVVAFTPASPLLLVGLLLVGAGALGLFPCYYALSQELSTRHIGKITGILGTLAWLTSSPMHKFFGRFVDHYHSYDLGIAIAGSLPLVALLVWWFVWDWRSDQMADQVTG